MSGLGLKPLLVAGLVAPDLLAREAERPGDGFLRDVLAARVQDGAAKLATALGDCPAGRHVGISGGDYIGHRVLHLPIMTWMWPLLMMPHHGAQRNVLLCHVTGGSI